MISPGIWGIHEKLQLAFATRQNIIEKYTPNVEDPDAVQGPNFKGNCSYT
jgi:hypothetical protein